MHPSYRSTKHATLATALIVSLIHCGGDDGEPSTGKDDLPTVELGTYPCGPNACKLPEEYKQPGVEACCVDVFAGTCGIKTRKRDDCREYPKLEPACPQGIDPDFGMYFGNSDGSTPAMYGCCTPDDQCGYDMVGEWDYSQISNLGIPVEFQDPMSNSRCRTYTDMFCQLASAMIIEKDQIKPVTCGGEPVELPEGCGEPWVFPQP